MKKSFTLIELIVVIAIIAALTAIIAPISLGVIEKAKIAKIISDYRAVKNAAVNLYIDTRQYPVAIGGWAKISNSPVMQNQGSYPAWNGPYIEKDPEPHPWGGLFRYNGHNNRGRGPTPEIAITMSQYCCPDCKTVPNCNIPMEVRYKMDEVLDDGNLNTGNFLNVNWILWWDPS